MRKGAAHLADMLCGRLRAVVARRFQFPAPLECIRCLPITAGVVSNGVGGGGGGGVTIKKTKFGATDRALFTRKVG